MKVCEKCGEEIYTKDGENRCQRCEDGRGTKPMVKKASLSRKEKDAVMRSLGLTKVRGAMGGVYWE